MAKENSLDRGEEEKWIDEDDGRAYSFANLQEEVKSMRDY